MAAEANYCSRCGTGGQDEDGVVCYWCRCKEYERERRYIPSKTTKKKKKKNK